MNQRSIVLLLCSLSILGLITSWWLFWREAAPQRPIEWLPANTLAFGQIHQKEAFLEQQKLFQEYYTLGESTWQPTLYQALFMAVPGLRNSPQDFSLHRLASGQLELLWYAAVAPEQQAALQMQFQRIVEQTDLRLEKRGYQEENIWTMKLPRQNTGLSYFFYQGYLVASFSGVLLEDFIIHLKNEGQTASTFSEMTTSHWGSIQWQYQALWTLLAEEQPWAKGHFYEFFAEILPFEPYFYTDKILLNGRLDLVEMPEKAYIKVLEKQNPAPWDLLDWVPLSSQIVKHMNLNQPEAFIKALDAHLDAQDKATDKLRQNFAQQHKFDWAKLRLPPMELALCASLNDEGRWQGLLVLKSAAAEAFWKQWQPFAQKSTANTYMLAEDWPRLLWGRPFEGFEKGLLYYHSPEILVFASSAEALKSWQRQVERGNVWAKSTAMMQKLSEMPSQHKWSVLVQPSATKQPLPFSTWAYQINQVDGKDFHSFLALKGAASSPAPERIALKEVFEATLDEKIIQAPQAVKSHISKDIEVLLQDEALQVQLVGATGKVLWRRELEGKMLQAAKQVDYYRNKKLQYALATERQIHLIDRNGKSVTGFPIALPSAVRLQHAEAFELGTELYFTGSTASGEVFIFDKKGKILSRWAPFALKGALVQAPLLLRIQKEDYAVLVEERGLVHIVPLQRPAEAVRFDLEAQSIGSFACQVAESLEDSRLMLLTVEGKLAHINLKGEKILEKQLLLASNSSRFMFLSDQGESILLRQDLRQVALLNKEGEELRRLQLPSGEELQAAAYYYLDPARRFVVLFQKAAESATIADFDGDLIAESLPCSRMPALYWQANKQELWIWASQGKGLRKLLWKK